MNHTDVVNFYASYGIEASFEKDCVASGYVYDNNKVALKGDVNDIPMSLHELAHWLVAIPRDRRSPNYNLGLHPSGWDAVRTAGSYERKISDLWEARACELHVRMVCHFFGRTEARRVADYLQVDLDKDCVELIWLQDMNLIDQEFRFIPKKELT